MDQRLGRVGMGLERMRDVESESHLLDRERWMDSEDAEWSRERVVDVETRWVYMLEKEKLESGGQCVDEDVDSPEVGRSECS